MQPSYEEKKRKVQYNKKKGPIMFPLTFTMPLSWYM